MKRLNRYGAYEYAVIGTQSFALIIDGVEYSAFCKANNIMDEFGLSDY